jgi:hypothetical protein
MSAPPNAPTTSASLPWSIDGNARGSDGRRAFVVPLDLASTDERFRALDRVTFKAWLDGVRLNAPTLRWYLDYCCRDDYGNRASAMWCRHTRRSA